MRTPLTARPRNGVVAAPLAQRNEKRCLVTDPDSTKVRRQIHRMADDEACRSYQRSLFDSIQARRRSAPPTSRSLASSTGPDRSAVGTLEQSPGFLVAVEGEVLVRAEAEREAATLLQPEGFVRHPVPAALEGRLVRFVSPRASVPETHRLARTLRARGVGASVNHVVPLGYVAKGEGGFEPTQVRPERAEPRRSTRTVKVAVIDTGIAAERRGDGWLADVVHGPDDVDPLYVRGREDELELDFSAGHGHFAAGIVEQVCPEAQLLVYRAVESDGIGSELDIAEALLRAGDAGVHVINLSLGTETADDAEPVGLQVALEALAEAHPDVVVVAAAGNSGRCRPTWPAAFRSVVSVASVTAELRPSTWSSRGPSVDCSAVGEGVVSTYVRGQESPEVDKEHADTFERDAWAVGTGTSFAAPQVTGRIAGLLSESPDLSPRQALTRLLREHGRRTVPGYGRVLPILPGTSTA